MKFKIDQNLPIEAADLLAAAGHDAMTVYERSLGGAPDEQSDPGPFDSMLTVGSVGAAEINSSPAPLTSPKLPGSR